MPRKKLLKPAEKEYIKGIITVPGTRCFEEAEGYFSAVRQSVFVDITALEHARGT